MGIFQQSPFETLILERLLVPGHSGQEAHDGIHQHQRRRLAARQHEIAEADLLGIVRVQHALIDAFEPAAQEGRPRLRRQFPHARLGQQTPARREIDQRPGAARSGDGRVHDVRPHHHPGAAAKRGVVDGAVFIAREPANVYRTQRPDPFGQAPPGQRLAERTGKHLGKQGQHGGCPNRFPISLHADLDPRLLPLPLPSIPADR